MAAADGESSGSRVAWAHCQAFSFEEGEVGASGGSGCHVCARSLRLKTTKVRSKRSNCCLLSAFCALNNAVRCLIGESFESILDISAAGSFCLWCGAQQQLRRHIHSLVILIAPGFWKQHGPECCGHALQIGRILDVLMADPFSPGHRWGVGQNVHGLIAGTVPATGLLPG